MPLRRRFLDLVLLPERADAPAKPSRDQLRGLSRLDRRRAKVRYASQAGMFRTWVYAATLVLLVGVFALYLRLFS
jgi:hypothetical protein